MAFFSARDAVELGPETMTREHLSEDVLSALGKLAGIEVAKGVGEKSLLLFDMVSDLYKSNSRLCCQIQLTEKLNGIRVVVAPSL